MFESPDAVQRERTQTSLRSLRKLDCGASGAPLIRDRRTGYLRNDPGSAAHHSATRNLSLGRAERGLEDAVLRLGNAKEQPTRRIDRVGGQSYRPE